MWNSWRSMESFVTRQTKSWIIPGFEEYNCTNATSSAKGPSAAYFLRNLELYQTVLISIAGVFVLLASTYALAACVYVHRNITLEQRRNKLYFLITLFPVSMSLCFIGMLMPRVASLSTSAGMLYFLMCLFVLVSLIRHLKRGRLELSRELLTQNRRINFQSPPICCFFPCLPEASPSFHNLRMLELIVLQAPIVRAVVLCVEATITVELQRDAAYEVQLCELATLISIALAVFGVHTLARLVSDQLSAYGFMWIFRIVDIALLCFSAQHPIIFQNILLRFNLLSCGPVLTPPQNARFLCNFIVIVELFFLSLLSAVTITPTRNKMFDVARKVESVRILTEDGDEHHDQLSETTITSTSTSMANVLGSDPTIVGLNNARTHNGDFANGPKNFPENSPLTRDPRPSSGGIRNYGSLHDLL